jgi:hypothetical protein
MLLFLLDKYLEAELVGYRLPIKVGENDKGLESGTEVLG